MKTFLAILCLTMTACGTLAPAVVPSHVASFDGNEQNSGIVSGNASGYIVTGNFRDRYNSLVVIYGKDFLTPLRADYGLSFVAEGRWLIDREHLAKFLEMTAWHRAGLKPKTP